jgi:phosphocarrier protein HPr
MQTATLNIINPLGLHARAASKLVSLASQFSADIRIQNDQGVEADGKRIMSLLLLGAAVGSSINVQVEGEDEADAMAALTALVEAGFHELEDI